MSQPTFFGEGSTPGVRDTIWKIEQKILGAVLDLGGSSSASGLPDKGHGAPTVANTGYGFYIDLDTGFFYKNIGTAAIPIWTL